MEPMEAIKYLRDGLGLTQPALADALSAVTGSLLEGLAAYILRADGELDLLCASAPFYTLAGYTPEQFRQEVPDPFACLGEADMAQVRQAVAALRDAGQQTQLECQVRRRDGQLCRMDVRITVLALTSAGEPIQLAALTDITQLAAVRRAQVHDTMNATPCGIAVIVVDPRDVAGTLRTTYYNDMFYTYSGYSREEYDALLRRNELSFVLDEDIPLLLDATERMCHAGTGQVVDSTVRCRTRSGGYRWLLFNGQLVMKRGALCVIHIVLMDITTRKNAEDRLRIREEMLRIAAETDKRALITYDVKANTCHVESRNLYASQFGETLPRIPQSLVERGVVAPDSQEELCALFRRIRAGESRITVSLLLHTGEAAYQWFACNATVVNDADGKPDQAVLVFHNITEQRIKEAVYKKWQNSIQTRPAASYTLFRCNLSRDASLDGQEGELLKLHFPAGSRSFNSRTREYATQYVYPEDREAYMALLDSNALLARFYRGEQAALLEYREMGPNGSRLWRRLTVEMVEYLNSADVQAFLLYEDIDREKKAALKEKELAETDPLTGTLNRAAFCARVDGMTGGETGLQHALVMLDMDGFKLLNDTFGHAAGDQSLIDIAAVLRSLVREGDLICRLGGDEFLVWLCDIPYDAAIDRIVRQMCEQVRKAYSLEVQLSASVGIAVYPRDGRDFDELYRHADKALYRMKQSGKDGYAFYSASADSRPEADSALPVPTPGRDPAHKPKRRMLIVDDSEASRMLLYSLFQEDYVVETAKSGAEAMLRLRHYSSAVSVVLLDLIMPGIDGFAILKKMQAQMDLRTIPVVCVSSDDRRETLLRAVECGAADFVTKPVDSDLIRLRVQSAISKAENERLRAQNSYLQLQRDEELKYRTVLESTGTVVVEYDWRNHVFLYDNMISRYIAGSYDHRGLWQVFLSDMVADSADVKALQDILLSLAGSRDQRRASRLLMLKTPAKARHWFRMNVYKREDPYGLAEKMIITFNDVHEEVLADERLRFQATHDELTGLYNRAGFFARAAELIQAAQPGDYVMACLDIEKFKVINDQYGTDKGDMVLRHVADTLRLLHDTADSACCRFSADHFAVLYPRRLAGTEALSTSHRQVEQPDSSLPRIRVAVGRYFVDDKTLDISAVYDRAAMAKDTIKGRYDASIATYDEAMRTVILRQQAITGQMKHALESGQFEVWLQPQFNHGTGMLSGAEALARWRHPQEGVISPAVFIPIFEQTGFIYELDQFVWEAVCRLLRAWLDQGLQPVPVSVNISRYDVYRDDLVSVIQGLVEKYRLPGGLLHLEITESAFSKSTDQIIRTVKAFVALGFIVEIDDFGSGYSSLNTLKDVPAQVLKMDMRFLENDANAQRGGSIVESVVRMARWLGMSVIAEGVETLEQADYLKSIGCEYVQGYLYARPSQVAEYEKLFAAGMIERKLGQLEAAEVRNNNAFWNPNSIETLIFNSYVGGACIFEYRNGQTELIRYNDGYAEMIGRKAAQKQVAAHSDIFDVLDAHNAGLIKANLEAALRTRKEAVCEIRLAQARDVRVTVRQLAQAGDRSLFYCVLTDVTAQRSAERREREAASRFAAILDHIGSGIRASVLRGGEDLCLFANSRYDALMGNDELLPDGGGQALLTRLHPDDRDAYLALAAGPNAVGQTATLEFRVRQPDGRWRRLRDERTVIALAGVDGPVRLSCLTDLTGRQTS